MQFAQIRQGPTTPHQSAYKASKSHPTNHIGQPQKPHTVHPRTPSSQPTPSHQSPTINPINL